MDLRVNTLQNIALIAALVGMPILASASEVEAGPTALARHFMVQVYNVKPTDVEVTTMSNSGQLAALVAKSHDHECRMTMVPAPSEDQSRFGWLVRGMQCAH